VQQRPASCRAMSLLRQMVSRSRIPGVGSHHRWLCTGQYREAGRAAQGRQKVVDLTLGELRNAQQAKADTESDGKGATPGTDVSRLGLSVAPASKMDGAGQEGVVIMKIEPKSAAADRGLKKGDVPGSRRKNVSNPGDIGEALDAAVKTREQRVDAPSFRRNVLLRRSAGRKRLNNNGWQRLIPELPPNSFCVNWRPFRSLAQARFRLAGMLGLSGVYLFRGGPSPVARFGEQCATANTTDNGSTKKVVGYSDGAHSIAASWPSASASSVREKNAQSISNLRETSVDPERTIGHVLHRYPAVWRTKRS
jgi:hypothetical protein